MKTSLLEFVPSFLRPPWLLRSSAIPKSTPPPADASGRRGGKTGYIPIWIGGQALPYAIHEEENKRRRND